MSPLEIVNLGFFFRFSEIIKALVGIIKHLADMSFVSIFNLVVLSLRKESRDLPKTCHSLYTLLTQITFIPPRGVWYGGMGA